MAERWFLTGATIGACNCVWGCPCSFDARPTYGFCEGMDMLVVREGRYGAVHDVPNDGTAFSYRDVNFVHIIARIDTDPANMPAHRDWVRDYWSALHPHSAGGAYVNFLMEEGQDRIKTTYRDNYPRLVEIKRAWDPENVFHMNQNIT